MVGAASVAVDDLGALPRVRVQPDGRDRHRHPPRRGLQDRWGALRHRSLGTVHLRLSGWMFLASAPMSLVGVALATWIRDRYGDGADSAMTAILGAAFLAGGLGLVAKSFIGHTERPDAPFGNVNLGAVGWLLI